MTEEQYRGRVVVLLAAGAFAVIVLVFVEQWRYSVDVRSHNLDVFYKSLTCDDLPLKGDTDVMG